ncbi:MAG: hypothetical protein ACKV2U_12860 [Bryobacteraceae bacterium]
MTEETAKKILDMATNLLPITAIFSKFKSFNRWVGAGIAIGHIYLALPAQQRKVVDASTLAAFVSVHLGIPWVGVMDAQRIISAIKNHPSPDEIPREIREAFQRMA